MSGKLQRYRLHQREEGLASFLVTAIMIIVISLIVLGFGVLARRENQTALDRQLSTQAYYAAESGVNDAIKAIQAYQAANPALATNPPSKTNCSNTKSDPYLALSSSSSFSLSSGGKASYSCLLIFTQPSSLVYDSTTSKVINIQDNSGASFQSLSIEWLDSNFTNQAAFNNCPSRGTFPASWPDKCDADVLRVDLVPAAALESVTPLKALESQTFTVFLYPSTAKVGPTITYNPSPSGEGAIVSAGCINTGCSATINNLNQNQYYMRVTAMYGIPQNITITGQDANGVADFSHGQAVIDSTGRAQNELRRIEVRTTINNLNNGFFPAQALQLKDSICKRFYITPNVGGGVPGNPNPGEPNFDSTALADPAACSLI